MGHYQDMVKENQNLGRELRDHIPEVYAGFGALHKAAFEEGALSPAVKEMMAVAIAVADECEGCIASHSRNAVRHGATEEEFAEMLGVVILMTGGPGTVYGPKALAAYKDFKERYG